MKQLTIEKPFSTTEFSKKLVRVFIQHSMEEIVGAKSRGLVQGKVVEFI